ncbi:ribokinase [Ancylobacter sp. 6x-1]|uniref:Deoxyribokinase n=1 Tax=Ancylobacter crimeensis TaxID=2579147 RepID=A0ABT0DDX3_9HYPH|nr:ribokinase [Ancylobacter crimeensis]MCK0198160.1 ribokinase [Ancylobacter crimeensis]
MSKIAVVGSNMMDLITYVDHMPLRGETVEAPSFEMGHGGKGANQAIAAARLGSKVAMVTRVGDDTFADATLANFQRNGIDVAHVIRTPGLPSGVAPIFVEPSGENSILIVKGANAALSPADVDAAADLIRGCALILMQLEIPVETVYHTVRRAREWGVPTLLVPAPALPDLDVAQLADLAFLTPNETELATLTGLQVESEAQAEAAAKALVGRGIGTVIVTMGGRGALLVTDGEVRRIEPVKVEPVDTTGAGDAFIGAFAHFVTSGLPVPEALGEAGRYAADSITRRGTQRSYATAAEFRSRFPG